MIIVYYWPTSNGHKIIIFLEEASLPYEIRPVDITNGEQYEASYRSIAPTCRIPAIVDTSPADGGSPISLFESGAILQYLAEKAGPIAPEDLRLRETIRQWLFWQTAHVGPMLGQYRYFSAFCPEKLPAAITRYKRQAVSIFNLLDSRLREHAYVADSYSIADIALYPWIASYAQYDMEIEAFPHVQRWIGIIAARPAVQRAYRIAEPIKTGRGLTDRGRHILFERAP